MKNDRIIPFEFHILMGLPGSGKTYWATHHYPISNFCNHSGRMIVDLDKHLNDKDKENWIWDALDDEFKHYMEYCHVDKVDVCIDGPIMTYDHLYKVIDDIISYLKLYCKWEKNNFGHYSLSFIIHQWDDNRKYCIHNDEMRGRTIKAMQTIRYGEYDVIDSKIVKKELINRYPDLERTIKHVKRIGHIVEKTTRYQQDFEPACDNKYGHGNDEQGRYLYSEEWSLGGEWGNCWGDHGAVTGEQAKEFVELDDFLEKVAPNITFLQYKKIRNHCVEQIEWHVHDYYSSGTTDACWRCDMKELYNLLKEMNYIEDYE